MTIWEQKLLRELIGLARATDGNEHLITQPVARLMAEVLLVSSENEAEYRSCREKILAAKREMVPDCFLCANPCGRTAPCDLSAWEREAPEIRQAKEAILAELRGLAASSRDEEADRKLCRGLVLLGMDGYSAGELRALFDA